MLFKMFLFLASFPPLFCFFCFLCFFLSHTLFINFVKGISIQNDFHIPWLLSFFLRHFTICIAILSLAHRILSKGRGRNFMNEPNPPMTSLDAIAGGGFLAVLKALVPFLPPSMQKAFAVALKCMELKNLLCFSDTPGQAFGHRMPALLPRIFFLPSVPTCLLISSLPWMNVSLSWKPYSSLNRCQESLTRKIFSVPCLLPPLQKEEGGERNDHV